MQIALAGHVTQFDCGRIASPPTPPPLPTPIVLGALPPPTLRASFCLRIFPHFVAEACRFPLSIVFAC